MILDWEENESLWVCSQQWLVHLLWLNGWSDQAHVDLCWCWLLGLDWGLNGSVEWHVLLAGVEIELLYWRVAHLQVLEGGGSLIVLVSCVSQTEAWGGEWPQAYLLGWGDGSHCDCSCGGNDSIECSTLVPRL